MPAQLPEFSPVMKGLVVAAVISLVLWLLIAAAVWAEWW
jgi:hypothetical protein